MATENNCSNWWCVSVLGTRPKSRHIRNSSPKARRSWMRCMRWTNMSTGRGRSTAPAPVASTLGRRDSPLKSRRTHGTRRRAGLHWHESVGAGVDLLLGPACSIGRSTRQAKEKQKREHTQTNNTARTEPATLLPTPHHHCHCTMRCGVSSRPTRPADSLSLARSRSHSGMTWFNSTNAVAVDVVEEEGATSTARAVNTCTKSENDALPHRDNDSSSNQRSDVAEGMARER